jgi:Mrp family chromosome partitioning ATPase
MTYIPPDQTSAVAQRADVPFAHLVPEIAFAGMSEKLEVLRNESSFSSEQFRTLKVRIAEIASDRPARVLTISSPDTQDGKSLISANLAASFSRDTEAVSKLAAIDLYLKAEFRFCAAG